MSGHFGSAGVRHAGESHGKAASGFDYERDPVKQNIMDDDEGWATIVHESKKIKVDGLAHFGTLCSSWTYAAVSVHRRNGKELSGSGLQGDWA